jgi:hypothetical protein
MIYSLVGQGSAYFAGLPRVFGDERIPLFRPPSGSACMVVMPIRLTLAVHAGQQGVSNSSLIV